VGQHGVVDQIVNQQQGGTGNRFDGFEGQQFRITGAGSDQSAAVGKVGVHGRSKIKSENQLIQFSDLTTLLPNTLLA
jgi:hypothetical protein